MLEIKCRMEIAVIGWGSLIWYPGCLRIKSRWRSDGPFLPIEFARISNDGRLTLVIHPGPPEQPTPDQRTYWALSEFDSPKDARANLQLREGAKNLDDIPSLISDGQEQGKIDRQIAAKIREWLNCRQDVQAAVWAGLQSNWERKQGTKFKLAEAVKYLIKLERNGDEADASYDRAREYVTNTPPQIQTPVRKMMREKKGWEDAILSAVLFERVGEDV
jgi:hypothetical protein